MIPRKLSIEVLLDPRNLLLPTIGLHHMEGRFLHLLTLLKIKFPLDHHLEPQKVHHRNIRPLHPLRGEMFMQLLVLRISTLLKNPTKHISFRILTPHQMTFIRYIRPNIAKTPHTFIWLPERSLQKAYTFCNQETI